MLQYYITLTGLKTLACVGSSPRYLGSSLRRGLINFSVLLLPFLRKAATSAMCVTHAKAGISRKEFLCKGCLLLCKGCLLWRAFNCNTLTYRRTLLRPFSAPTPAWTPLFVLAFRPCPALTKWQTCYSNKLPLQQKKADHVDEVEFGLTHHPLALYPHLEEGMPPEVWGYLKCVTIVRSEF